MSNKRVIAESTSSNSSASSGPGLLRRSVFPQLSDELRAQLETAPRLARKSVSDGYKFHTSLPSYQGMAIGPTTTAQATIVSTGSFNFGTDYDGKKSLTEEDLVSFKPGMARHTQSMGGMPLPNVPLQRVGLDRPTKRGFDSDGDDTDTDDDMGGDKANNNNNPGPRRIYTSPRKPGLQSFSGGGGATNNPSINSIDDDFEEASFLQSRESLG